MNKFYTKKKKKEVKNNFCKKYNQKAKRLTYLNKNDRLFQYKSNKKPFYFLEIR